MILGEIPWATFFLLEPSLPAHRGLTGLFSQLFLELWETACAFQRRKRETGPEADMYLPTGAILLGVEISGGERGVTRTMALIYSKRSLSLLFGEPWPSVSWTCQSCFLLLERVKLRQSLLHKAPFAGWIEGRSMGDLQGDLTQSIPYNKGSQGKLD